MASDKASGAEVVAPQDDDMFEFVDITRRTVTPPKELLVELKAVGWSDWAYYPERKELSLGIKRRDIGSRSGHHMATKGPSNDGNNLCRYANAIRRYINARTEVYVLDFTPNHEQVGGAKTVIEVGDTCLVNEVRIALNNVMARQVRGNIYELHAVNATPFAADIMTRHITLKGAEAGAPWHDNFPPTIKLGQLEPGAELHISMIFMKPGRVFTNTQPTFENGEIVQPPDYAYFLHNGLTKWSQPDMIDPKTGAQLRDPMLESPHLIVIGFHPQPYIDPSDILMRALQQLADDFIAVANHVEKARGAFAEAKEGDGREYAFGDVAIKVAPSSAEQTGPKGSAPLMDLMCTTSGFDVSIGVVIASNAGYLGGSTVAHNSAHLVHVTKKDVIIRITAPDAFELFARAVKLAVARTKALLAQFGGDSER